MHPVRTKVKEAAGLKNARRRYSPVPSRCLDGRKMGCDRRHTTKYRRDDRPLYSAVFVLQS